MGFAGAYAPSKHWKPPTDQLALKKLNQFQDLKFGFFIHWGPQTQWGVGHSWMLCGESWCAQPAAYEEKDYPTFRKAYRDLYKTFNPVKFNPQGFANLAEAAGTKYLVFVTKHHDGFCNWDTKTTDYKITSKECAYSTNPNADITKQLFDAFRKKDFWIGAYFSKADWDVPYYWSPKFPVAQTRNPNYSPRKHPIVWNKFKDFTWAQIRELMTDYGPIDILWLDGGQVKPPRQNIDMPGIARMARKLQPGLLMVDRTVGRGNEDFLTPEGKHHMPTGYRPYVWEACITLGGGWCWNKGSSYLSSGEVIRYLVKAVARNGNLLLDVGPDAQGVFDQEPVTTLKEVGNWLKVNGEAIYVTRPIAPYELGNVFFTRKPDGTVYAIALNEKDGDPIPASVTLPASLTKGAKAITLVGGDGNALKFKAEENGTTEVTMPIGVKLLGTNAWTLKISK